MTGILDPTLFHPLAIITLIVGLYMAWNIGANDVANAMGTSVGSGALTFRNAVILAGIFEFAGAVLVGAHVTDTVRKGIVDTSFFTDNPMLLAYGMCGSILAAAVFLNLSTWFGLPVSTTHSIVGAIAGFGIAAGGLGVVAWDTLGLVVARPRREDRLRWTVSSFRSAPSCLGGQVCRGAIDGHRRRATR